MLNGCGIFGGSNDGILFFILVFLLLFCGCGNNNGCCERNNECC